MDQTISRTSCFSSQGAFVYVGHIYTTTL